jgi:hypothetical protein
MPRIKPPLISAFIVPLWFLSTPAHALDYPHVTAEPQKTGWPPTTEARAYVVDKPEHDRRPGGESNKHLPHVWLHVPSAGHWGGTSWLDTHAKLVDHVQANQGPIDVLLVGDSITQQWGSPLDKGVLNEAWKKHFENYKTINIGIGGDKAQNVLWRLDHGGVEGLQPKVVVVMIGINNMFFTPETGVEAAAKGIEMCNEAPPREVPSRRHYRGEDPARARSRQSLLRRHQKDQRRPRPAEARQRSQSKGARSHRRFHECGRHHQERSLHTRQHPPLTRWLCGYAERLKPLLEGK